MRQISGMPRSTLYLFDLTGQTAPAQDLPVQAGDKATTRNPHGMAVLLASAAGQQITGQCLVMHGSTSVSSPS